MSVTAIPPVAEPRLDLSSLAPDVYRAQARFSHAAGELFIASGLSQALLELIRIRVSQINGCAFCLDMHTKDARHAGEREDRIYVLSAWREAPFYDPVERAALALAEAVTGVSAGQVPDELWAEAAKVLNEAQLAAVVG
ncbi:MAG: carboxymuconolactone decarboxylase family protein, partial [Acidimicrobiaceae bacterium]|nr:carboxymuconolactone decarboxylase family protein [Acidimicrobiaceae bacterium]